MKQFLSFSTRMYWVEVVHALRTRAMLSRSLGNRENYKHHAGEYLRVKAALRAQKVWDLISQNVRAFYPYKSMPKGEG